MNIFEFKIILLYISYEFQNMYYFHPITEIDESGIIIETTNIVSYIPRYLRSNESDIGTVLFDIGTTTTE